MAKNKEYTVMAKLELQISKDIVASSLDEALEKSKKLTDEDFVEFLGDYMDGSFIVTGIYEQ